MKSIEPQLWILLDVLIASILAAFVGLEREEKAKPAGIRTNMIVAGASCLFVSLTPALIQFIDQFADNDMISIDPIRTLQALVVGLGFIGGGTILKLQKKEQVQGLTTAATLLYTSGLGVSIALGQYLLGIGITLVILFVNFVIDQIVNKFNL
jgi:putative Mg2+ transporter-C (MgtC) family protein